MAKISKEQLEQLTFVDLNGGNHVIPYTNGSGAVQELAHGTSGYVLTSNGPSSDPSWQAPSGGGGGGKFNLSTAWAVVPGASGRYYAGSTSGGVNNEVWNSYRSPYTSMRGVEVIRYGIVVPDALNNCGAKGYFWIDGGGAATVIVRLLKLSVPSDGSSYTTTVTVVEIGNQTINTTAAQEFWSFSISSATSIASNEVLVFGIESDQASINHFGNVCVFGDY